MSKKAEWVGMILIVILSVIVGAMMFSPDPQPPEVITNVDTVTVTVIDYIDQDPIVIEKIVTLRDTIFIESGDTVATEVAQLDTVFSDSSKISIDYFVTPRAFKVDYTPAPIKVKEIHITKTEYIDTHKRWDNFKTGTTVGIVITAIIVYLVK